jgi:hypothetical protein
LRHQASQLPNLSPATRKIATRLGPKANHPYLGTAGRWWPQLFHVVEAAALNPVGQRPSKCRAVLRELVYGILDEVGCLRVALTERQVPGRDLVMEP